jgi:hypothetical protein
MISRLCWVLTQPTVLELLAVKLAAQHAERLDQHAADAHAQLYRLERGNAVRVFRGKTFAE